MAKRKPDLAIVLGGGKPDEDEGEAPDHGEMMTDAMSDFIDAVHAKDPALAVEAFKQLCELHKDAEGEDY